MMLSRLALVVLFTFVASFVSATAGDVLRSWANGDQINHSEGSPCPDPDEKGYPCQPACACTCCPGHATAAIFVPQLFAFAPPASEELNLSAHDDLHPKDIHFRIFHPPRS